MGIPPDFKDKSFVDFELDEIENKHQEKREKKDRMAVVYKREERK